MQCSEFNFTGAQANGSMESVLMSVICTASDKSNVLVSSSYAIASLALITSIGIAVYSAYVSNEMGKLIPQIIKIILMTCISVAILGKWQDFNSTMSDILTKNIPAAFGSGSLGDAAIKTAKIYPDFLLTLESIIDKRIKDSYSLPFIIAESLKQFGYAFIGLFLIGIPSILLLLSMLYYSIGALLSVAIGVAFGPPIIALLPWDRTSWLAENWLRYMITNLLTVTVALFIISLALSAQVLINQNIEAAMSDFTLNPMKGQLIIGKMLIAGLLMLFLALFIGKAEGIASALISGGSSGASGGMARSVQLISRSISGASKMTGGGKPPGGGASKTTGGGKPLEK